MTSPELTNIILNCERVKASTLKFKNKTRMHTIITLTQHSTGNPNQKNQALKKKGKLLDCNGRDKISLFCR